MDDLDSPSKGRPGTPVLYPRIMGAAWDSVDECVREIHFNGTPVRLAARFDLQSSRTKVGRLLCALTGLPKASGTVHGELVIDGSPTCERWVRSLGTWHFMSTQIEDDGFLIERVGPINLRFSLSEDRGGVKFKQVAAHLRIFGVRIRLPRIVAPTIVACERPAPDGRTAFVEVALSIPVVGALVSYRGEVIRSTG